MDKKSVSSLEEAMKVFRHWKNSPRQMVVVCVGADGKSTFSVQGYIAELSDEFIVIAGREAGHCALALPGLKFGLTDFRSTEDPIDTAKATFPLSEVIEIQIPGGGRALIIPSPVDASAKSKAKN